MVFTENRNTHLTARCKDQYGLKATISYRTSRSKFLFIVKARLVRLAKSTDFDLTSLGSFMIGDLEISVDEACYWS